MGSEGTPVLEPLGQHLPPLAGLVPGGTAALGLPGRLDSVRRAREFTRDTLQKWQLGEELEPVALVVSELVTNALRHGVPPWQLRPEEAHRSVVELELMLCAGRLVCAVQDPGSAAPRMRGTDGEPAGVEAESGRGLHLVESFSDGWGWRALTNRHHGKVVWAVFRLSAM